MWEKKNYSGSQNSKSNGLSEILRKFFAEVKTERGPALTLRALTGIRAAIHRHLTSPVLHSAETLTFCKPANSYLPKKCLSEGQAKKAMLKQNTNHAGDMQKLNRYFMEGQNTDGFWRDAEKLAEFIWFSLCFQFARRGREG